MSDILEVSSDQQFHQGGFYLIATMLKMEFDLPVEITPTIRLEVASPDQMAFFRGRVEHPHLYETEIVKQETPNGKAHQFLGIPENEWRYYILSYAGDGLEIHEFLSVANLIAPYPISLINCHTKQPFGRGELVGLSMDPVGQQAFYSRVVPDFTLHVLKWSDVEEMKKLFLCFGKLDKVAAEGILRAVRLNRTLQRLGLPIDFPILGLFMIIEMLLTHNPNDKEIGDSLTHQIKTKMAFVSPRFQNPLDYSRFGPAADHGQIWGALYTYRSCIAHGNHIDFSKGPLSKLKSSAEAFEFLEAATKELLAYAIREPSIVNGLKPI